MYWITITLNLIFLVEKNRFLIKQKFTFLDCAFHNEPIEFYWFAFSILGVWCPLIPLNQTSYNGKFLTKFMA